MTVKSHLAREAVEAVVVSGASSAVVGNYLICKVGIWKRAKKVKVKQVYGSFMVGNIVVNMSLKVMHFLLVLFKFAIETKVLDIESRDVILSLSSLTENRFSMDAKDRCLRNVNTGQVIHCSVGWIPEVLIIEEELLEHREILLINDASQ